MPESNLLNHSEFHINIKESLLFFLLFVSDQTGRSSRQASHASLRLIRLRIKCRILNFCKNFPIRAQDKKVKKKLFFKPSSLESTLWVSKAFKSNISTSGSQRLRRMCKLMGVKLGPSWDSFWKIHHFRIVTNNRHFTPLVPDPWLFWI